MIAQSAAVALELGRSAFVWPMPYLRGLSEMKPSVEMTASEQPEPTGPPGPFDSARDLRVVFVTDIMTPYTSAVFEELALRCRLTVLYSAETGSRAMQWSMESHRFHHHVIGGWSQARADAADTHPSPAVITRLAKERPDVIISGGFAFPSLYAALYRRTFGCRLLIHSDGTRCSEASFNGAQRFARALLARLADGAIGNSKQAVERFEELGFAPVFEAPHSSNLEPFLQVARRRARAESGELRVIVAGRLIPRKGVDRLLYAVALARRNGAAIALTVVGSGEQEALLRELAGELGLDDVCWRGFVEQRDLAEEFAAADVFAFPTLEDPFGIVLLEAAAAGLALIASPHAGATGDLLIEAETGFVVEPDDVDGFAGALARLATDPALRARLGQAANTLAAKQTPTHTAQAYLRAASAICGRKAE
jgi:glycosyltransferase involved in cell wall biosynthesis